MNESLDLSRWRETPRGVAYRRGTMIATGLRQLTRTRFFRALIIVGWFAGILIAVAGFVFSQSLASGGWFETWATRLGPRAEAIVSALTGLVAMYPDIVVGGVFTVIFWIHSFLGLWLSLFALTALVPNLITRDRSTNALTVYLSRPLTSGDYLLGKLGIITAVLLLTWTGPLLLGWLLSMLVATDRDFLVYSFTPLLHALEFNALALVALAALALGVSALARSARIATLTWIGLWVILGFLATPPGAPKWITRASFTHDLSVVRQEVFRVDRVFADAAAQLPLLDPRTVRNLQDGARHNAVTDFSGSLASLAVFSVLASAAFVRRLRPE